MRFLCLAILVALVAQTPAAAQKLRDKSKPRNHPINCPHTAGDPELLARIGVLSLGGFDFATEETTQAVDAFLAVNDVKWVETAHYKIGFALGPYRVTPKERLALRAELTRLAEIWPEVSLNPKMKVIDPWLRVYLFAMRAEEHYREVQEILGVTDEDFPDGSKPWDTTGTYMGIGPYLGEKGKYEVLFLPSKAGSESYLRHYFGLRTKYSQRWNIIDKDALHLVIHIGQGSLKVDTALHGHFVFNQTQQLLDGFRHYSYEIPVWIKEGLAHWMERRVSPEYNSFDSSEGAVPQMTKKDNWEPPTRRLVQQGKAISMARLMAMSDYAELTLPHHYTTWSMVDYLMREHPGAVGGILCAIKGLVNEQFIDDGSGLEDAHRQTFKELLGMTYAQFDRAWAEWVLTVYSNK